MSMTSGQEPAIVRLLEHVRDFKGEDVVQAGVEHNPVKDSQANGLAERAVQTLGGQIRTMILALGAKLDCKIDPDNHALPWLIIYAGVLINRFLVGPDNKTAHERLRGRKSRREPVEFG